MLLWNAQEDDHEKKWEDLNVTELATCQNGSSDTQLAPAIRAGSSSI